MHINELFVRTDFSGVFHCVSEPKILGMTDYSGDVKKGYLFAALSLGDQTGHYIEEAISKGASYILLSDETCEKYPSILKDKNLIVDKNPRLFFSKSLACFYENEIPNIVAVTGTNGKSSTVHFFRQLSKLLDHKSASIGTLGVVADEKLDLPESNLTTPSAITMHKVLKALSSENYTYVAIEASSHGLDQYRLHGVELKSAAFTNFTQDHLDYHGSMENYFKAKIKLFTQVLTPPQIAVLNADIVEYEIIRAVCQERDLNILTYGRAPLSDLRIHHFENHKARVEILGKMYESDFFPFGEFQLYNAMAALGLMMGCGEGDIDRLVACLPHIEGVPGRMEFAGKTDKGARVLVDYAHTPDALENILKATKSQISGKLWVVFGCGGDRDPLKRPIMGAVASKWADQVIVTDDNPRWENPEMIRSAVLEGAKNALEIGDRLSAISYAMDHMEKDDVLVIAGKGHETGQIIQDQIIPFNDRSVVQKILKR